MWEWKLNFLVMHFEYICMLFCQVNCATPLDKSLNSPWGPLCRCRHRADNNDTFSLSHALPPNRDTGCRCLYTLSQWCCLHLLMFAHWLFHALCLLAEHESLADYWLLSALLHEIVITPLLGTPHYWLAPPNMLWSPLIGPQCDHDSLASATPTLTFVVLF